MDEGRASRTSYLQVVSIYSEASLESVVAFKDVDPEQFPSETANRPA